MKKSDLKKIGTIVETRNKKRYAFAEKPYWCDEQVLCCLNKATLYKGLSDWDDDLKYPTNRDYDIMRVQEPFGGIYWERPAEILDDKEREYLSAALKPFIKKIKSIAKYRMGCSMFEFIDVDMINANWSFPNFKKGTKYKGMETGKSYTPEELGLE